VAFYTDVLASFFSTACIAFFAFFKAWPSAASLVRLAPVVPVTIAVMPPVIANAEAVVPIKMLVIIAFEIPKLVVAYCAFFAFCAAVKLLRIESYLSHYFSAFLSMLCAVFVAVFLCRASSWSFNLACCCALKNHLYFFLPLDIAFVAALAFNIASAISFVLACPAIIADILDHILVMAWPARRLADVFAFFIAAAFPAFFADTRTQLMAGLPAPFFCIAHIFAELAALPFLPAVRILAVCNTVPIIIYFIVAGLISSQRQNTFPIHASLVFLAL
jgi:hypothetical protein